MFPIDSSQLCAINYLPFLCTGRCLSSTRSDCLLRLFVRRESISSSGDFLRFIRAIMRGVHASTITSNRHVYLTGKDRRGMKRGKIPWTLHPSFRFYSGNDVSGIYTRRKVFKRSSLRPFFNQLYCYYPPRCLKVFKAQ